MLGNYNIDFKHLNQTALSCEGCTLMTGNRISIRLTNTSVIENVSRSAFRCAQPSPSSSLVLWGSCTLRSLSVFSFSFPAMVWYENDRWVFVNQFVIVKVVLEYEIEQEHSITLLFVVTTWKIAELGAFFLKDVDGQNSAVTVNKWLQLRCWTEKYVCR